MKTKKIKDEIGLVKYITNLRANITAIKLLRSYEGFSGKKNDNYFDELDAVERKYGYIEKLLKNTPNFKLYLTANMKRRMIFSEILKDKSLSIDKEELTEEVFYLICHIKLYEEKIAEEMTNE